MSSRWLWVLPFLSSLLLGCGGGGSDPVAAIEVQGGQGQTATVGSPLPGAVSVRVLTASGFPAAGQSVSFHVTGGGGSVFSAVATTDDDGRASDLWTLGTTAGPQSLEVRWVGSSGQGLVARFTAVALPGPAAALRMVSGGGQLAERGLPMPDPVVVEVTDTYGNAVPGVELTFVPRGEGSASPTTALTDAGGRASTIWTLGVAVGEQFLDVGTATLGPVPIGATARLGGAAALSITGGNQQTLAQHTALPQALAVRVTDSVGDPVQGVEVRFVSSTPDAYVESPINTPAHLYTDVQGVVAWQATMHSAGAQQITATVTGLVPVVFVVDVTPAGSAIEGGFRVSGSFSDAPAVIFELDFTLRAGALYYADPLAPHDNGIVAITLDEATGSVSMQERRGLNYRTEYQGHLVVAADGGVSGSGTLFETDQGAPTGRTGTWTIVKVHD